MFADVFATVRRAPERLRDGSPPSMAWPPSRTRIVDAAILDLEGVAEPVSARLVSLPDEGDAELNRIYLRRGRTPDPERPTRSSSAGLRRRPQASSRDRASRRHRGRASPDS